MKTRKEKRIVLFVIMYLIIVWLFLLIYNNRDSLQTLNSNFYNFVNGQTNAEDPTNTDPNTIIVDPSESVTTIKNASTSTSYTTVVKNIPIRNMEIGHEIGIAAGGNLVDISREDLEKNLNGISALGIKWVRFDIEWGFVQYDSPDKYDWSRYDKIVNALNRHNLKALPILTYTPQWARDPGCRGGAHCPPLDPKTFAKFSSAAVNHYKNLGVHYWEIWNEPNSYDFWATKSDCSAYTKLLIETYPMIKQADPNAFVITGGFAPISTTNVNISPTDFLECIYKNGGKNYFNAIGNHPYTFPETPKDNNTNAWVRMSLSQNSLRSIMIKNGDGKKKMWLTEFGAPTNGPDEHWFVSEDGQSQMVKDTMSAYKDSPWAGPLFWYTYIDSGTDLTTNENFFGLVRKDGSQKPAYDTLKALISGGI